VTVVPQTTRAAKQRRTAAANRARAALPHQRRPTAAETLARRGTVILGIVVVLSLIAAIASSYNTGGITNPLDPHATVDRRGDPNALIAAATANPQNADAVHNLADYYGRTGQYANALPLYQRYLQLRPDDAAAHVSTGELLLAGGDTPGAQSQFAQALALKPDDHTAAQAHLGFGSAYAALNPPRLSDAFGELTLAANLDPDGEIGNAARDRLAGLQQQYGVATVTDATAVATTVPLTASAAAQP